MSKGSSSGAPHRSTGDLLTEFLHATQAALHLPARPTGRFNRPGLSKRGEHVLDIVGTAVLVLFAGGWFFSILTAERAEGAEPGTLTPGTAAIASALTTTAGTSTAYLTDAAVRSFTGSRGLSGKLRVTYIGDSTGAHVESLPAGARVVYTQSGEVNDTVARPAGAGVWRVAIAVGNAIRPIADFDVISLRPASEKRGGRLGLYYIGNWPTVRGSKKAPAGSYASPSGFIEVTQDNADTYVSQHFRLRDFLTHDQPNVWPKYLVLRLQNVDKLELVLADLASRGVDVSGVRVMSGFRTPQYNAGGGNTAGRAELSRHMYGDAADIFIDSNGDGVMDDLNHDGRLTIDDARVIAAAADRVEAAHPELVGGVGVYTAAPGHGPFIHIDTRGYRARWTGTGGG